jgi:exopolysaccharide biosynthesis polyprenyl glycosylphosphotransferase
MNKNNKIAAQPHLTLNTPMHNLLPKSEFLNRLRIEKLRVNRSKASLSVVLFYFQQKEEKGRNTIEEFIALLDKSTRESDIKGWVDRDVIGLILPDTDENGVKRCVKKISESNGNFNYSVTTGTYPDHFFMKLLTEEEGLPDLFPFDLDEPRESHRSQMALKRVIDVLGALVGLILFSPIMLATAIAIKMTSPGPIIFKQTRFGRKGARFQFYKFRSMYWNIDDQIHREYVTNLINGDLHKINQGNKEDPLFKMVSDPRITRVGKIIRKTSIDEVPQLFNVLKGEMSLVGPRPPVDYEVQKYEPWHLRRVLEVKPGITGLWQVSGRSRTSFDEMVRLDLRYVQNWSTWVDLKIILKTVKAVFSLKGAW